MIGTSRPAARVRKLIELFGQADLPVLVSGDTGSGKEVVARLLHRVSSRDPFVSVNCASISEHLFASELFGHVKGAFTGADREHYGLFFAAEDGTLFLDEVGELPLSIQAKFLRVLDIGEVLRVGSVVPEIVRPRVIAATNLDLEVAVRQGTFRADLYWRLKQLTIDVPPLARRGNDAVEIARKLCGDQRLTPEALTAIANHNWPGNVRELKHVLGAAEVLARGRPIRSGHLGLKGKREHRARGNESEPMAALDSLRRLDVVREHTAAVLKNVGGDIRKAAAVLGVHVTTLRRNVREWDLSLDG